MCLLYRTLIDHVLGGMAFDLRELDRGSAFGQKLLVIIAPEGPIVVDGAMAAEAVADAGPALGL